jgi:hypothetical protein
LSQYKYQQNQYPNNINSYQTDNLLLNPHSSLNGDCKESPYFPYSNPNVSSSPSNIPENLRKLSDIKYQTPSSLSFTPSSFPPPRDLIVSLHSNCSASGSDGSQEYFYKFLSTYGPSGAKISDSNYSFIYFFVIILLIMNFLRFYK